MRSTVLIAGVGRTGSQLARNLCREWTVSAVDESAESLDALVGLCKSEHVRVHRGDATSELTLRRLGVEDVSRVVACLGSDEANLVFLRLLVERFAVTRPVALVYDSERLSDYEGLDADVVERPSAAARLLGQRVQLSQRVAADVGLGRGEIMEVEVLQGSSLAGRALADLHPKRWIVGAVYRGGEIIVPHGETTLQTGDRVLIIGDPEILPSIGALIRAGEPEFPLQYGSHVMVLCDGHLDEVIDESIYLVESTRADKLEAIACRADENQLLRLAKLCEQRQIRYEFSCSKDNNKESLLYKVERRDLGVLVRPPHKIGPLARLGWRRTRLARVIELVKSPVLISRRTFPYRNVLMALGSPALHPSSARLTMEVVRMFGARLHLAIMVLPEIVVGAEEKANVERQSRDLENLAAMHRIPVEKLVLQGNPIYEVERISKDFDLLVVPYRRKEGSFLTRPNVGLNLIHRAACSVMVMPV